MEGEADTEIPYFQKFVLFPVQRCIIPSADFVTVKVGL